MLNFRKSIAVAGLTSAIALAGVSPAQAGQKLSNNLSRCNGSAASVLVNVSGVKSSTGTLRVQLYRGTSSDWLQKGKWLNRIEIPARAGSMKVCMPTPGVGVYGIAIRHDVNGNGDTDISQDGGGMSNNPSINIFNLGKPSYKKTQFNLGKGGKTISIKMKYM